MTITIEKELTQDHIKVLNVLRNTKHNIITKQNIFNQLNMEFTKNNERWLQHTINSLVVEHGYPIGYSYKKDTRGYFWIKSKEQKEFKRKLAITNCSLDLILTTFNQE